MSTTTSYIDSSGSGANDYPDLSSWRAAITGGSYDENQIVVVVMVSVLTVVRILVVVVFAVLIMVRVQCVIESMLGVVFVLLLLVVLW